ncbi:hypothetical protein P175DRAFT_0560892 [Aspergillus ochraceoroseus IBT 24754]|uniref:Uncharacterized protein n=2 Tax=Aspergillus ochraceoroseus TaxID=138278 RepID=A0A2T5LLQ4_9EURO|nr:uncharacterized protein P175DRAFT_0560892 [Aspergillus ochraceoroseus IBT 24754]KKK15410.1 hypothetical protein AOCH_006533 [Aspergillus ochraceoroseus]PTU17211.1 hypothetical protein P175DRAFT_0560892 [Aspergillus ochraceoroseus IBT 24754]
MDLQPPSVLAQLPRPLHASTGKTHISEVYSLADSKKRKRYEVAVAVDGEAVNIYNIQTPKLVTSYAVPPQSSFCCQPCSLRRKLPKGSAVKRQTFVAVKKEIKSFLEESGGSGSSAPTISSSTFTITDSSSPTVFIGIVPGQTTEDEEEEPFDILAVHRDGRVRRLSPDLGSQRWSIQHSELAKGSPATEVHASFLLELDEAKKSLLKKRPDLVSLSLGDLAHPDADEPSILMLVSHPAGAIKLSDVKVHLFSVPATTPSWSKSLDESQQMRHLLTMNLPDIPEVEQLETLGLQWHFHSGSAGLNLSFDKGFINFDLSQYAPTVISKFILDGEDFSSLMRISPQSVIAAGKSMVALYDTQYKSIQRSIATGDLPGASSPSSAKTRTVFISHFAKLDLVVATKGSSLLAFDLASSQNTSGSKRSRDGLLIDAIGRGLGSGAAKWEGLSKKQRCDNPVLGLSSSEEIEKWNKLTKELRDHAKSKDTDAFDRGVQAYFGTRASNALPSAGQYLNPEKILFLLSLIFTVEGDTPKDKLSASSTIQMSVSVWPEHTCRWLLEQGHLCPGNVEAAVRRAFKPRILPQLPCGSFTQAIKDSDPSLERLISALQGPAAFSTDEIAQALKLLLNQARTCALPDEEEPPKALTNGESTPNGVPDPSNTSNELCLPSPAPPLANIFRGLNTALLKIHTHPLPTIVSSLRSALSRTEIISMIYHLRLSLATGGHTSRFTETPPTPITPNLTTPPLPLSTIIDLLNVSIDAIGPSGWISATDFNDTTSRDVSLIAEMKSEVSAALAGVEEATFLTGILREYIRYAQQSAATSSVSVVPSHLDHAVSQAVASSNTAIRREKLNGADLLVFGGAAAGAAPDEDGDGLDADASGKLLPLSLRAASDVSKTKVIKATGKVVQRSKREIGYLRRKAAGKYTFERLVL